MGHMFKDSLFLLSFYNEMRMKKTILIFLTILFSGMYAHAQWATTGARNSGMGGISVTGTDVWSAVNNQAGMAFFGKGAAGVHVDSRYLIKELSEQSAAVTMPFRYGSLGAIVQYSGDADYNRMKTGISYGRTFGNRFAAGLQLDYLRTALGNELGSSNNVTFEAGIMLKLSDKALFATHVFNPVFAKLSDGTDRIPAIFKSGIAYTFSDAFNASAEFVLNSELPADFAIGAEYSINQQLFVRAGVRMNPFIYTFGFGYKTNRFSIDLGSAVHEQLGITPQASLQYQFLK